MTVTIWHNPACGTSRNTLAMIRAAGIEPVVIEYLRDPPSRAKLVALITAAGLTPRGLLREKGTPYAELGLEDAALSDDALVDAMLAYPMLIKAAGRDTDRNPPVPALGSRDADPATPAGWPIHKRRRRDRSAVIVRDAAAGDVHAIATIYAHHVAHGTASFDTEAPNDTWWQSKVGDLAGRGWPFVVAEHQGQVAGYAYATQFRDRAAYAETCENSIYVAPEATGRGISTALLSALIARAEVAGFRQMIAVIGGGEPGSVALHAKLGFVHAGRLRNVGRKFGRLLDTVYMQRAIGTQDGGTR